MAQQASDSMRFTDTYKGNLNGVKTTLELRHCHACDYGIFTLTEKDKAITGEWTVLRGDATDRNAVVVNLYAEKRDWYFLRTNKTTLQKLDSTRGRIAPKEKYILRKKG
jgi:hypothetical protein